MIRFTKKILKSRKLFGIRNFSKKDKPVSYKDLDEEKIDEIFDMMGTPELKDFENMTEKEQIKAYEDALNPDKMSLESIPFHLIDEKLAQTLEKALSDENYQPNEEEMNYIKGIFEDELKSQDVEIHEQPQPGEEAVYASNLKNHDDNETEW